MPTIKLTGELETEDDGTPLLSVFDRFSLGFAAAFGKGCGWITAIALGLAILRWIGLIHVSAVP
jgi:hypothetical protein